MSLDRLPPHRVWTREQVLALPDDGYRYELVDGQLLVSPSQRADHQRALMALIRLVDPYVERHAIGELLPSPSDLNLFADQRLQPDLFVIPIRNGERFSDWPDAGIPLLVVEILSPESAREDCGPKRQRYQRSGVPDYWIVDLDDPRVEVWTPTDSAPTVEKQHLIWRPIESLTPLEIDLGAFFTRVFDIL